MRRGKARPGRLHDNQYEYKGMSVHVKPPFKATENLIHPLTPAFRVALPSRFFRYSKFRCCFDRPSLDIRAGSFLSRERVNELGKPANERYLARLQRHRFYELELENWKDLSWQQCRCRC